ncbi:hypothetical protein [Campylobacter ureolyticus]|uniref:Excinuclease ABC subunit A n=1 Tax=Campylobacter ureolyticus TaxID=827 RepID=A0A9Q4PSA2_9BACT|nr:hypothetical protein [Campylobacter ureolyticus]MCZ6159998.1 hypothetical protein [Campylobacter ureolyticus]MCZ6163803.1 hypothetical protein [Campylobacter ureolyticus]MCZ6165581.1 hypothetical protein [Campylobacter ureolyticus]MCZ6167255.1 hypothetical protein [Campylobacter ureolyticus]
MKKVIFSVFVLFSFLNSATLLEYDTVENDNDVVLKLFFDSAFEGGIFEKKDKDNLIIILENTQTNEKFTNQLNSNIIKEFVIQNNKNNAEISIKGSPNLETNASILQDGLELNVKFTNKIVNNTSKVLKDDKKSSEKSSGIYKFLIAIVFLIFIIAFIIYKKIKKQNEEFDNFSNAMEDRQNEEEANEASSDLDDYYDIKDDKPDKEENFEEKMLNKEIKTHNELYKNDSQSDASIIYHDKIDDEKEVLLIKSDGKVYLSFISLDNEIPQNIYEKMLVDKDKFKEFLEICKSKNEI